MERLQKVLANSGVASRRKSEELIRQGKVKVNGKVVTEMGFKVSHSSLIEVNNVKIQQEDKVYFLLNKPRRRSKILICSLNCFELLFIF